MDHSASPVAARARTTAVWLAVTTAAGALVALAGREALGLGTAPAADFARLLVQVAAVVAVVSAAWLWLLTSQVALAVLRSPGRPALRRVGALRGLVLAACGIAALGSTTPAWATTDGPPSPPLPARVLDGLPLPDRATAGTGGDEGPSPRTAAESGRVVTVQPGDSLWAIADRVLGPAAAAADLASYSRRVHGANRSLIGPDPDLIHPGQQLRLPPA